MKEEVIELIKQIQPMANVESESLFNEIDSLDIANVLAALSDKYSVDLNYKDVSPENFKSVDSLVTLVKNKLKQ